MFNQSGSYSLNLVLIFAYYSTYYGILNKINDSDNLKVFSSLFAPVYFVRSHGRIKILQLGFKYGKQVIWIVHI